MISNKKKIALVLPSLKAGGMERVASLLSNYFVKKINLEVHIILFGRDIEVFYELDKDVIIHKPAQVFNSGIFLLHFLLRLVYIRKTIKSIKPDAVLSFGTQWNNFISLSLINTNYPVFLSDRGSPVRNYGLYNELLRKYLYKKAKGIISQTKLANEILKKRFSNVNIVTIGNPIEIDNSMKIQSEYNEKYILSIGRLIKTKHQDRLIKIFLRLNKPDWKLIIVGGPVKKGEDWFNHLQKIIIELGLEKRVILTGEQKDVKKYYALSQIFAFTSSVEGFPNVIGEALASGLPVVAYDCIAGPSEMIKNSENGFLVPVFDDEQFLQKLQLLVDDEDLRNKMSEKARESIKEFDINIIGEKYLNFILPENDKI